MTFTSSISTTTRFRFNTTTGDGTSGVLLYGAQAELTSSYATSYIPTLGTSVTRVADAASKTGISSLIGQTEGTMFLDADIVSDASNFNTLMLIAGTTNNNIVIATNNVSGGRIYAEVRATTQQALISSTINSGRCKIALAYKANDIALYINGNLIGTDTSATIPATTDLTFSFPVGGGNTRQEAINQALLFKTRLTNAQMQALTTL